MNTNHFCFLLLFSVLLASCGVRKYIPEDKTLFDGPSLEIQKQELLENESELKEDIFSALYPLPNRKVFGLFRLNLWIHFGLKNQKDKWYVSNLYNRFARDPIYIDEIDQSLMEQIIKKKLQDHGHFNSSVTTEVEEDKKIAKITYKITPSTPTMIAAVERPGSSSEVENFISTYRKLEVRSGRVYRLKDFTNERAKLAQKIRAMGYYDFKAQDVSYLVDTSNVKDHVNVIVKVKKPAGDSLFRKYYIRDVNIYSTSGALGSGSIQEAQEYIQYKTLNIYQDYKFIDKRALSSNVLIDPGDLFSITKYNLTLSRLLNLNIFKYVNIEYRKVDKDSLDVDILLTPNLYLGAQYDIEASTSDRSFLGASALASFNNSNVFNRAEKFTATLRAGSEFQYVNNIPKLSILNANLGFKYEFPRLIIPFSAPRLQSAVPPKTFIGVDEDYQLWLRYFTMNSTNLKLGYEWQSNSRIKFLFEPLFFNLVDVSRQTAEFDTILLNRPSLQLNYQDILLIGSQLTVSYNTKVFERQRNHAFFRLSVETSGNSTALTNQIFSPTNETPGIAGVLISQYIKTDFEMRLTRDFNTREAWVTRLNLAIVSAYGLSQGAPFIKQFFIGGSTSLRGFEYGSVGPGRYSSTLEEGFINPVDQAGDFKLLFNTEYRFPLFSVFRGAVFIDAGNVWLLKDDITRPESFLKFNRFFKEIALNTGLGLRMDFDYLALRLDFGIPLYSPFEAIGKRWTHQRTSGGSLQWLKDNLVFSAGIGYPF